jgi:hypothetical protein
MGKSARLVSHDSSSESSDSDSDSDSVSFLLSTSQFSTMGSLFDDSGSQQESCSSSTAGVLPIYVADPAGVMELLEVHAHEVECGLVVSGPSNPPSQDLPLVVEEPDPNLDELEAAYLLHQAYWEGYEAGYAAQVPPDAAADNDMFDDDDDMEIVFELVNLDLPENDDFPVESDDGGYDTS